MSNAFHIFMGSIYFDVRLSVNRLQFVMNFIGSMLGHDTSSITEMSLPHSTAGTTTASLPSKIPKIFHDSPTVEPWPFLVATGRIPICIKDDLPQATEIGYVVYERPWWKVDDHRCNMEICPIASCQEYKNSCLRREHQPENLRLTNPKMVLNRFRGAQGKSCL
ncbi:hypothetical protein BC938DRAFT_480560 [Jimgerdemannia flammicorona]|uniref:Uncharacterized protein n=1 Tax=Jimgerdemannia flammicorona TaxID=994334 RepID=A0A433QI54_9FUNG|nr:hypothetical protein BC938DRAFT_480560 [Jimgerdemannia flammicorona]